MNPRRTVIPAMTFALAATAVLSVVALAAPGAAENSMKMASGATTIKATQGSYCTTSDPSPQEQSGVCADYQYPLHVRCRLPVKPGGAVTVTTAREALTVSASLIGRNGLGKTKRVRKLSGGEGTTWRFQMPKSVKEYAALSASASYENGDSNTWAGLKTQACRDADFSKP